MKSTLADYLGTDAEEFSRVACLGRMAVDLVGVAVLVEVQASAE